MKTAWYSGKATLFAGAKQHFDYIKLRAYIEERGGLNSPNTNQRLYQIVNGQMTDITNKIT